MVALNTTGVRSAEDLVSSFPAPGRYHAMVSKVDESMSNDRYIDQVMVEFEILTGTVPGQAGRKIVTFFSTKKDHGLKRLTHFCVTAGLMGLGEAKNVVVEEAVGRQIVVEVEEQEWQGKTQRRVSWSGVWSVDDAAVADVPKDATFLATRRQPATTAPAAQAASTAPAAVGVTAVADKYADL